MGTVEIITLTLSLIATYGPKAIEYFSNWQKEVGDNPTPTQWNDLKNKIANHNPDSY